MATGMGKSPAFLARLETSGPGPSLLVAAASTRAAISSSSSIRLRTSCALTVTVGKPQVEDCGIVGGVCQRFPRIGAPPHGVHGKLGALQLSFDDFRNSRLIFDDQKTHALALSENWRATFG